MADADSVNGRPAPEVTAVTAAASPPVSLIVVASVLSVAAVVLLVLADFRPPASLVGWVLAGPVATSLFIVYTIGDTRARRAGQSAPPPLAAWLYPLGLSVMWAAIVVNALSIGLWLGAL